jgi:hypothetical protein
MGGSLKLCTSCVNFDSKEIYKAMVELLGSKFCILLK